MSKFLFYKVVCLQSTISVHCFSRTSSGHCFCKFSEFRNMKSNPLDWLKTQSQSIFLIVNLCFEKRPEDLVCSNMTNFYWLLFSGPKHRCLKRVFLKFKQLKTKRKTKLSKFIPNNLDKLFLRTFLLKFKDLIDMHISPKYKFSRECPSN